MSISQGCNPQSHPKINQVLEESQKKQIQQKIVQCECQENKNIVQMLQRQIKNLRQTHKFQLTTMCRDHQSQKNKIQSLMNKSNTENAQLKKQNKLQRQKIDKLQQQKKDELQRQKQVNDKLRHQITSVNKQIKSVNKQKVLIQAELKMTQINYQNQKSQKFKIIGEMGNFKKNHSSLLTQSRIIPAQINQNRSQFQKHLLDQVLFLKGFITQLNYQVKTLRKQNAQKLEMIMSLIKLIQFRNYSQIHSSQGDPSNSQGDPSSRKHSEEFDSSENSVNMIIESVNEKALINYIKIYQKKKALQQKQPKEGEKKAYRSSIIGKAKQYVETKKKQ